MSVTAHSTIVNVSPETAQHLSEFICHLVAAKKAEYGRALYADCLSYINGSQTETLLLKLLEQTEAIVGAEKEADAEGSFQALAPILFTLEDASSRGRVVASAIENLTSTTSHKSKLRLQILVSLFNLMVAAEAKYDFLLAIFSYAAKSGQAASVAGFSDRVDAWVDSWELSLPQRRALYHQVAETLAVIAPSVALRFRVRHLDTFPANGEMYPPEVLALATAALVNGINSRVTSHKDRNALLQSFSKHASSLSLKSYIELLRILCEGSLEEYRAFANANAEFMTNNAISASATEHSMRLLCLCTLAAQEPVLSYARVAAVLQVDAGEVEAWIVEAIAHGLIDATIDQLPQTITVTRFAHRSFGQEQWAALQQRLTAWRKNIASLVELTNQHEGAGATRSV